MWTVKYVRMVVGKRMSNVGKGMNSKTQTYEKMKGMKERFKAMK